MANEKVVSPKGELEWVTITGEGKENLSGTMQYLANVVLSQEAGKPLKDAMDAFWADNKPKGIKEPKSMGYYDHTQRAEEPDENGDPVYEPTGKIQFSFKTGVTYTSGDPKVVQIYNSKGKKVNLGTVAIGNGSIGQISGSMGIYQVKSKTGKVIDAGVTLYLDAIKISKLVEFSQDAGFEADEDDDDGGWTGDEGFEGEEAATPAPNKGPRL